MKIIEFCGCPGCGKSTVCDALEKELTQAGYRVINLQKRKKCDTIGKKIDKIIRTFQYRHYGANRNLKHILYSISKDHKWADRILEAKWLISRHGDYDYVLFDEGGIQFVSSLTEDSEESLERVQKVMNSNFYVVPTILFQCHLSQDENIKRLLGRNKAGDRFVTKDESEMRKCLEAKEWLLNSVCTYDWEKLRTIEVDTWNMENALEACLRFVKENYEDFIRE